MTRPTVDCPQAPLHRSDVPALATALLQPLAPDSQSSTPRHNALTAAAAAANGHAALQALPTGSETTAAIAAIAAAAGLPPKTVAPLNGDVELLALPTKPLALPPRVSAEAAADDGYYSAVASEDLASEDAADPSGIALQVA